MCTELGGGHSSRCKTFQKNSKELFGQPSTLQAGGLLLVCGSGQRVNVGSLSCSCSLAPISWDGQEMTSQCSLWESDFQTADPRG